MSSTALLVSYDPALAETVKQETGDEEVAVILRLSSSEPLMPGVREVTRFGDIVTVRVARSLLPELAASAAVQAMERSRRLAPGELASVEDITPHTTDVGALEHGFLVDTGSELDVLAPGRRRPEELTATGRGVVVGILDFGIDFAHPSFRHSDGTTRIRAFWDQQADGVDPSNRWGYGRIHDSSAINRALERENPYAELGYHPSSSDEQDAVGQWKGAHGTHVLSIAAGSDLQDLCGVAPDAELVCVQLARTVKATGPGNLGDSASVLEAIDFIFRTADGSPTAINLSLGAHGGPHDGSTLVELGIDQAVLAESGRAIVNSAGNYFERAAHAEGRLTPQGSARLPFLVPEGDTTDSEIEVFYRGSGSPSLKIVAPGDQTLAQVGRGENAELVVGDVVVGHVYYRVRPTFHDHHIDIFLRAPAPSGAWQLHLEGDETSRGTFHAWIERDSGKSPIFVGAPLSTRSTTGTLCNGHFSITVGAVDELDGQLGPFSSSGPTRDGRMKPEVLAAGIRISAAQSTPFGEAPGARTTRKSGTSMAAPHVTGTIALMFEAAGQPLGIADTRALLLAAVDRPEAEGTVSGDLHRTGFGALNIVRAERLARAWGEQNVAATESAGRLLVEGTDEPTVVDDCAPKESNAHVFSPATAAELGLETRKEPTSMYDSTHYADVEARVGLPENLTSSNDTTSFGPAVRLQPRVSRSVRESTFVVEQAAAVDWCALRQAIAAAARAEHARWRSGRRMLVESNPSQLPILTQYWAAAGLGAAAAAAAAANSAAGHDQFPWSAAFICFVMQTAGVLPIHGFAYSSRHITYIVEALRNRERSDRNRPFWLVDAIELQTETPRPGDLLCFNRCARADHTGAGCRPNTAMTQHSYQSLRRRYWEGGHQAVVPAGSSHCSLVVGTVQNGGQSFVETIGGNEGNSVDLHQLPLDAQGNIVAPAAHHIFGMIKIVACQGQTS
jgi:subtilisin family serine protease